MSKKPDTPETLPAAPEAQDLSSPEPITATNVIPRIIRALGPVFGGLIIDLIDLFAWGPPGIIIGFILGGLVAYWIGGVYGWPRRARLTVGILAGIYCSIPMSEFIPIATILGASARFFERPRSGTDKQQTDKDKGTVE